MKILRLYPAGWEALSRAVKECAGWRCEGCGLAHKAWGWRDDAGVFHEFTAPPPAGRLRPPFTILAPDGVARRVIEIVLAAAHLDRDHGNTEWDNLAVFCQRCHLRHDLHQHRRSAAATRRGAMATPDLFGDAPDGG